MSAAARLRQSLQWPRTAVMAVDVLALLLAAAAIGAYFLEIDTDADFVVAQILFTAAIPVTALAFTLAVARIGRTGLDIAVVPVSFVLLLVTALLGWALCWAAGLGGERCWWESLDP